MGIHQLLPTIGPGPLTPEEAINFFYDNTLYLVARDINNVQSWVAGTRFFAAPSANSALWQNTDNTLFQFTVSTFTGKAAESNFTTVLPIAYGNDDYAASPSGHIKSFSDLKATLWDGGVISTSLVDNPGHVTSDFGDGIGTFELPASVKNINFVTLDITQGSTDDAGVYHTALIPGRWAWQSNVTSHTVLPGAGPFTFVTTAAGAAAFVSEYAELPVTLPPFGFFVYCHASNQTDGGILSSSQFFHQFATLPAGTAVAFERRPLSTTVGYADMMVVNLTDAPKTVTLRLPWTLSVEQVTESGNAYVPVSSFRFGAAHVFAPRPYFDVPNVIGQPPASGFLIAAANAAGGNPTITFNPAGTISNLYDAGDSTTTSWAVPPNQVNGSYYFARFTQTATTDGVNTTVTGGALDTWIPLTSNVSISRTPAATGTQQTSGTIDIATTPNSTTIVSTGTYRLDTTAVSGGSGGGSGGGGGGGGVGPTDPGTGGTPGVEDTPSSIAVSAFLPSGIRAGDAQIGDGLLVLSADKTGYVAGSIASTRISTQQMVTLISASGIRLTVSAETPVTLGNGISLFARDAVGVELPVQDSTGFRWEKIVSVMPAGEGLVQTIYCNDQCYAAGDAPDRFIWTHNATTEKV